MSLEAQLLDQLQSRSSAKRWLLAYSGGLDSTVLLHLLIKCNQQLNRPLPICAIHINHQLSPLADQWARHCEMEAAKLNINFHSVAVVVKSQGNGLEAAAREARYKVFQEYLKADDCLLLAHHLNDQAETFLLRLLRGAGVQGLAAMEAERGFHQGSLLRPLLQVPRDALQAYALKHQLRWVDDESNESLVFDRNYLRHQILPVLEDRWQNAATQLAKTTERLRGAHQLLTDLAVIDLGALAERNERAGSSIDQIKLRALGRERVNNLIRYWCQKHLMAPPNGDQLQQVYEQLVNIDNSNSSALVCWDQVELRQFNRRLYLMKPLPAFRALPKPISWDLSEVLSLDESGTLSAQVVSATESQSKHLLSQHKLRSADCRVGWRQGGERCKPAGRSASQLVKKLLQEYHLETWLRDRVPLLYIDGQLAAVADLWVCDEFKAKAGEPGWQLQWDIHLDS